MKTTILALLSLAILVPATASADDYDTAWEEVQLGAHLLKLAEEQRPTIAEAQREAHHAAEVLAVASEPDTFDPDTAALEAKAAFDLAALQDRFDSLAR